MTTNTTYQPTFLQKLLGRNYKWWYLCRYYFWTDLAIGNALIHWIFGNLINVLGMVYLWKMVVQNIEIAQYIFIGNILARLMGNWVEWNLAPEIHNGKIVTNLIQPSNVTLHYFLRSIAMKIAESLIFITLLVTIGGSFFQILIDYGRLFWLLPLILVGLILNFFTKFLLGSVAFWDRSWTSFLNSFNIVLPFLSGSFLPLNLLPLANILICTPFAFTFYHPMQIYLGKYDTIQTIWVFVGGITWCVVLYFLAKLVFKLGLKRNESVGL